jgi:hypothetical protein
MYSFFKNGYSDLKTYNHVSEKYCPQSSHKTTALLILYHNVLHLLYPRITSNTQTTKKSYFKEQRIPHIFHTLCFSKPAQRFNGSTSANTLRMKLGKVTTCFHNGIPKLHQVLTERKEKKNTTVIWILKNCQKKNFRLYRSIKFTHKKHLQPNPTYTVNITTQYSTINIILS